MTGIGEAEHNVDICLDDIPELDYYLKYISI